MTNLDPTALIERLNRPEYTPLGGDAIIPRALLTDAIALLTKQQAEIERLTPESEWCIAARHTWPKQDRAMWWRHKSGRIFRGRRSAEIVIEDDDERSGPIAKGFYLDEFTHWSPILRPLPPVEGGR